MRNQLDAFDGEFTFGNEVDTLTFSWKGETTAASLTFEPKRGLGVDNQASVCTLRWTDPTGDHETDDLLADPPTVD